VSDRHPDTLAVHAGRLEVPSNQPSSPPLYQASSYEFEDLEDVAAIYSGEKPGKIYGRYGGPNAAQLEAAMAELEGAEAAVATSAGMSAIDAAFATTLGSEGGIVATGEVYGGTYSLLENDYRPAGYGVHYVDQTDLGAVAAALKEHRPKILYLEALTNPLMHVGDLAALSALAHEAGALAVVDATFASPVLIRPLDYGVDLVAHSLGKYVGGHGDVGGGILVGPRDRIEEARAYLARRGGLIAHFEAWLSVRGLRTLALRMDRHSSNARTIAAFLAREPAVTRVHHPSRSDHPQHDLAARLYPRGTGGIVAFDLGGGAEAVARVMGALETISIVHSLGEVATTMSYPAVASHRMFPADARRALGVSDGTVRISVGIEDPGDITRDLSRALAGLGAGVRA
jgi:cystathionine beta-lyase/cystathionine gamma-synthase